jgi:hypothetical protein
MATGGGWFYWPGTTDRTNFGFTMKYNRRGTRVQGNLLIIRHGRGFPYLRSRFRRERGMATAWSFLWLPVLLGISFMAGLVPLLKPMSQVGHLLLGLVYSSVVAISMWVAWETVRFELYPRQNAWMVGIAMTCWFLTEVVGETYNVQLGRISDVAFNIVWVFYGTTILCLALSGYRWISGRSSTAQGG